METTEPKTNWLNLKEKLEKCREKLEVYQTQNYNLTQENLRLKRENLLEKSKRVIDSCKTEPQLSAAKNYVRLSKKALDQDAYDHLALRLKGKEIELEKELL